MLMTPVAGDRELKIAGARVEGGGGGGGSIGTQKVAFSLVLGRQYGLVCAILGCPSAKQHLKMAFLTCYIYGTRVE